MSNSRLFTPKNNLKQIKEVDIGLLLVEPHLEIFPTDQGLLDDLTGIMIEDGFDSSKPIDIWKDENIIVDGHTRYKAAMRADIEKVTVFEHEFDNFDSALAYAIHNQRDRRNLSPASLLLLVDRLNDRWSRGGDRRSEKFKAANEALKGKTAERIAKSTGFSRAKVEKARLILEYADDEILDDLYSGSISVNRAYERSKELRDAERQLSTKPMKSSTEWTKWQWAVPLEDESSDQINDAAHAFFADENSLEGAVWERTVCMNHGFDLLSDTADDASLKKVADLARDYPDWAFVLETGNYSAIASYVFPTNIWVGAAVYTLDDILQAGEGFSQSREDEEPPEVLFVHLKSLHDLEPKLVDKNRRSVQEALGAADWIIIDETAKGDSSPESRWRVLESLLPIARDAGCSLFMTKAVKVRPREKPY